MGVLLRLIVVLIIGIAVGAAFYGCGSKPPPNKPRPFESLPSKKSDGVTVDATADPSADIEKTKNSDEPKLEITQQGINLTWVENGKLRMKARAKEGIINENTQIGTLKNFSAELYDNGKLTAFVSAPLVKAEGKKRIVTATGGVTLRSNERDSVLKAKWIKWYEKKNIVVGNGGITITSRDNGRVMNASAAAFVANTSLKTVTLKDSAKGLLE